MNEQELYDIFKSKSIENLSDILRTQGDINNLRKLSPFIKPSDNENEARAKLLADELSANYLSHFLPSNKVVEDFNKKFSRSQYQQKVILNQVQDSHGESFYTFIGTVLKLNHPTLIENVLMFIRVFNINIDKFFNFSKTHSFMEACDRFKIKLNRYEEFKNNYYNMLKKNCFERLNDSKGIANVYLETGFNDELAKYMLEIVEVLKKFFVEYIDGFICQECGCVFKAEDLSSKSQYYPRCKKCLPCEEKQEKTIINNTSKNESIKENEMSEIKYIEKDNLKDYKYDYKKESGREIVAKFTKLNWGFSFSASELVRLYGWNSRTFASRLREGSSMIDVLITPLKKNIDAEKYWEAINSKNLMEFQSEFKKDRLPISALSITNINDFYKYFTGLDFSQVKEGDYTGCETPKQYMHKFIEANKDLFKGLYLYQIYIMIGKPMPCTTNDRIASRLVKCKNNGVPMNIKNICMNIHGNEYKVFKAFNFFKNKAIKDITYKEYMDVLSSIYKINTTLSDADKIDLESTPIQVDTTPNAEVQVDKKDDANSLIESMQAGSYNIITEDVIGQLFTDDVEKIIMARCKDKLNQWIDIKIAKIISTVADTAITRRTDLEKNYKDLSDEHQKVVTRNKSLQDDLIRLAMEKNKAESMVRELRIKIDKLEKAKNKYIKDFMDILANYEQE